MTDPPQVAALLPTDTLEDHRRGWELVARQLEDAMK